MTGDDPFDAVMGRLRAGEGDAAAVVFRRFTHRLIALARARLEPMTRCRADVEDVVQSVYKSFFTRLEGGSYELDDWDDLWGLLTVITLRKCSNRRTYLRAKRRDVRREVSALRSNESSGFAWGLVDREPTPLEAASLADTVNELFRGLDEPDRETISMLLQGYTAQEIGSMLACSERTVRRVRRRVKDRLKRLYEECDAPETG